MPLHTLIKTDYERPGFSNGEIIRNAPRIVQYAIAKGWCSAPQPYADDLKSAQRRAREAKNAAFIRANGV